MRSTGWTVLDARHLRDIRVRLRHDARYKNVPRLKSGAYVVTPYLTDEEIEFMTRPLTQSAARVRFLRAKGFHVIVRPDGAPTISRSNYDRVTSGIPPATVVSLIASEAPNEARFREGRSGKKAQG